MPIGEFPDLFDIVSSPTEKDIIPISTSPEFCGDHVGRFNGGDLSTIKQGTGVSYSDRS